MRQSESAQVHVQVVERTAERTGPTRNRREPWTVMRGASACSVIQPKSARFWGASSCSVCSSSCTMR